MKSLYESILDATENWTIDVLFRPLKTMFESPASFEKGLYILKDRLQKFKMRRGKRIGWMLAMDFGWDANTLRVTDGDKQVWEISSIRKNKDLFIEYHKSNDFAINQIKNSKEVYCIPNDLEPLKKLIMELTPTVIHESILDQGFEDTIYSKALLSSLFDDNLQHRQDAMKDLLDLLKSHNAKQHKTTAKMKNSDSYFVEFIYPLKIENGEAVQILDQISYMQICKKIDEKYITIYINANEDRFGKVFKYELSWRHTQPHFNPKSSNSKLYEVPEDLNDMFRRIQMEAHNSK